MQSQSLIILTITGLLSVPPMIRAQDQQVQEQATVAEPVGTLGTLAEMSPGPVIVTYENGELTIKASAVPLLEVLRRVCNQIGADMDAPSGASELISADIGPGPAREVLSSLLTGSPFNYAMQASDENPNVLARLILFRISGRSDPQNRAAVLEASGAPPTPAVTEAINPKEVVAQIKDLVAEAKDDIANWASDGDQSVKEGAAQLLSFLENSMGTLAANDFKSGDVQPTPSAPSGASAPPGRPHHRRR